MDDTTCSRDAISWLPDEVLGNILSLLPIRQAASTSLLSKKWRNVFRLARGFDFHRTVLLQPENGKPERGESFRNFLDRTQCGSSPIMRFSVRRYIRNKSEMAYVGSWISDVVERGVLEVEIRIKTRIEYFLPCCLCTSETLVKLTLGTDLSQTLLGKLPSHLSLPSLKILCIRKVFFEYLDFACVLLAGCPVLEELSLHYGNASATPPTISSPTVKRLLAYYNCCYRNNLSFDLPNLIYLDYSDFTKTEHPRVNLDSLVEARLDIHLSATSEPLLTNLIVGIRNVEIFHLSCASVDVISQCVERAELRLPVFNNLVNLSFGSKNKRGWEMLACMLNQSPKLKTLIIQDLNGYTGDVFMPLNQVKELHILNYGGSDEEFKQMKSFVGETRNVKLVLDESGLRMLLGVSLPSE